MYLSYHILSSVSTGSKVAECHALVACLDFRYIAGCLVRTIEDCIRNTSLHRRIPNVVSCVVFQFSKSLNRRIIEHPHSLFTVWTSQRIEEFHHIIKCNACTCGRSAVFRIACSIENTGRFSLAVINEESLLFLRTDSSCKFLCNV